MIGMDNLSEILSGKTKDHLDLIDEDNVMIHKDALTPFLMMKKKASLEGIYIKIASSFRSFERQLSIWNDKVQGIQPIYDENQKIVDPSSLSIKELIFSILRWSALPGMSRHHWGTDLDIFDSSQIFESSYQVQLLPSEYAEGGPFYKLHQWLKKMREQSSSFDFFWPYEIDKGGIAPEPWHISYRPLAEFYQNKADYYYFIYIVKETEGLLLKDKLLKYKKEIFDKFYSH